MIYYAFYHSFDDDNASFSRAGQVTAHTTTDTRYILQPEDCAMSLKLSTDLVEAAKKPLPRALQDFDKVRKEIDQLLALNPVERYQYYRTLKFVPFVLQTLNRAGDWAAKRDATDAFLAMQRFKLKYGRGPTMLAEVVPEFLPRAPLDPFDGQPLRLSVEGQRIRIYSIGDDGKDDGGESDGRGPDVALEMTLR
jgi:hypothetical protein